MKKHIWGLIALTVVCISLGCKRPKGADTSHLVSTNVNIKGFLGACARTGEGSLRGLKVRISVDVVDGQGNVQSNFKNYVFNNVQNDETVPGNNLFTVDVPQSGTYAITVTAEAKECFKCCQGSCTNFTPAWGYPYWRGVSSRYNTYPPPAQIDVALSRVSCD